MVIEWTSQSPAVMATEKALTAPFLSFSPGDKISRGLKLGKRPVFEDHVPEVEG